MPRTGDSDDTGASHRGKPFAMKTLAEREAMKDELFIGAYLNS